jgi:hypothetical protein
MNSLKLGSIPWSLIACHRVETKVETKHYSSPQPGPLVDLSYALESPSLGKWTIIYYNYLSIPILEYCKRQLDWTSWNRIPPIICYKCDCDWEVASWSRCHLFKSPSKLLAHAMTAKKAHVISCEPESNGQPIYLTPWVIIWSGEYPTHKIKN